jgi:hypothetical protein
MGRMASRCNTARARRRRDGGHHSAAAEFYKRHAGALPTVDQVTNWLRRGSVSIRDGDDEDDHVQSTNLSFLRLDAVQALIAAYRELLRMHLGPMS